MFKARGCLHPLGERISGREAAALFARGRLETEQSGAEAITQGFEASDLLG